MALRVLADMHVHSCFSVDSAEEIPTVCRAAVAKGLGYIAFTEHLDLNPADRGYGFFDYPRFSAAIDEARQEFGDKLLILKGLEFSEPHLYPAEFEKMSRLDFDVILGSVHFIGETFVGESSLRQRYPGTALFELYYEQVLQAVRHGGFDILAHLDFPKRYHGDILPDNGIITEIVNRMAKQDIGLEINTSPLRKGLNEPSPGLRLLQLYAQAGGCKVTLGSDAHRVAEIAADFETTVSMVREVPGVQLGFYSQRQFTSLDIHG